MSDSEPDSVVDAEELASHIMCPQRYEFAHTRPITPRPDDRNIVRNRRRTLLSDVTIAGLTADAEMPDERVAAATERLDEHWVTGSETYLTAEQETFDKSAIKTALEAYFRGAGEEHAENLIETDTKLSCSLDNIEYQVAVDAVVKLKSTYTAIQYQPNLAGVHPSWKDNPVEEYRNGDSYYPRQIGHIIRAAIAMMGLLGEYGLDSEQEFTYVSLLSNVNREYGNTGENQISAIPEIRRFQEAYSNEKSQIRSLMKRRAEKILNDETDIPATDFEAIHENACGFCPYQDACSERIEAEVSFTIRTQTYSDSDEHSTNHPPQSGESN